MFLLDFQVSLLLGTIIRKIPLLSNSCSDSLEVPISNAPDASTMSTSNAMLDLKQLEEIGNHFLEVLLKMKHNGAIDKTRAGFTALCNRLLCSNDPRYVPLTPLFKPLFFHSLLISDVGLNCSAKEKKEFKQEKGF